MLSKCWSINSTNQSIDSNHHSNPNILIYPILTYIPPTTQNQSIVIKERQQGRPINKEKSILKLFLRPRQHWNFFTHTKRTVKVVNQQFLSLFFAAYPSLLFPSPFRLAQLLSPSSKNGTNEQSENFPQHRSSYIGLHSNNFPTLCSLPPQRQQLPPTVQTTTTLLK